MKRYNLLPGNVRATTEQVSVAQKSCRCLFICTVGLARTGMSIAPAI